MSSIDILAYLYRYQLNLIEANTGKIEWGRRDRVILSKGHAGIAMYAGLKHAGCIPQEMIDGKLRGENSILFRHPKMDTDYAIEYSAGSLGMGLGYGCGLAETFRRRGNDAKVYVIVGDGECDEGSVWESAAYAGHAKLNNLTVIIDKNGLQLDGRTQDVIRMDNMTERWGSFGFETVEINGHDFEQIAAAFGTKHSDRPLAVIANTVKGRGVSFAEDKTEWHDNFLSDELYRQAQEEIGASAAQKKAREKAGERYRNRKIQRSDKPCVSGAKSELSLTKEQIAQWNRLGMKNSIGSIVQNLHVNDKHIYLIYADCAKRIAIEGLVKAFPGYCIELGISEQNMITMAAAIANEGNRVIAAAYAPFITARVLDQIRVNLGYIGAPVCLVGLDAGFAASDLGATHTALEDIANMRPIPNMNIWSPTDAAELEKVFEWYYGNFKPTYVRVTNCSEKREYHAVDFKLRCTELYGRSRNSGETPVPDSLRGGHDRILILAADTLLGEVLTAKDMLAKDGVNVDVISVKRIKPLPDDIGQQINDYETVFTVEEHNIVGGFGSQMAELVVCCEKHPRVVRLGVDDCYYKADVPEKIRKSAHLDAEDIARTIKAACGVGNK